MSPLVDRVRGHLAKHDLEEALATLIDAWHELRAPAIADAIDAIDAREPTEEPPDTKAWIAAARVAKTHRERGALLRTIMQRSAGDISMVMAIVVASRWDDPRLTTRIVELLTTIPFSGKRTRDTWRAVFEAATAQRDPRFLTIAKTLPPTWNVGDDTKTFLTNRLKEVTKGLAEPALPPAVRDALEALTREIAPRVETPTNAASLLDAIYANPDDDDARLVYADWLQERGDPLGEFIALQMQPADKRDLKAEQALIKQHKKAWLGPLATVLLGDVEFRRGFVAKGTARFRHQRDAEQLGGLREWATVEDLAFNNSAARDDQATWTRYVDPAMTGLRILRFPDVRWLESATPWRIEELWLDLASQDDLRAICESEALPRLRNLVVRDVEPALFADLARCPPHLTVIDGSALRDRALRQAWFAAIAKLPVERFTIMWFASAELHHHFTRDVTQEFTRLEVEVRPRRGEEPTEYEIREITAEIDRLPEGSLTYFEARVVHDGESHPIPELVRSTKRSRVLAG